MDADLRELERAGDDAPALVARAAALARAGRSEEAVRLAFRAQSFGAAPDLTAPLLATLGAPASAWPTPEGEGHAGSTRAVGPRAGRIVADAPIPGPAAVVVDRDGSVVCGVRARAREPRCHVLRLSPALEPEEEHVFPAPVRGAMDLVVGDALYASFPDRVVRIARGVAPATVFEPPAGDAVAGVEATAAGIVVATEDGLVSVLGGTSFRVPGAIRGFAAREDRVACLVGEYDSRLEVRALPDGRLLGASVVPGRSGHVAVRRDGAFLAIGTVDEGQLFPPTHSATLHAFTRDGVPLLPAPSLGYADGGLELAVDGDGTLWVASDDVLTLVAPAGKQVWHEGQSVLAVSVLVDGEGVGFVGRAHALVARTKDNRELFALPGPFLPRAIDGRGRLLAERTAGAARHLIAVE